MRIVYTLAFTVILCFREASAQEIVEYEGRTAAGKPADFVFGVDPYISSKDTYNLQLPLIYYPLAGSFGIGYLYGIGGGGSFTDISLSYGQRLDKWRIYLRSGNRDSGGQMTLGGKYDYWTFFLRQVSGDDGGMDIGVGVEFLHGVFRF